MRITMATSPRRRGGPNEDFVGAVPGAVVVLDGAGMPGTEECCRHGASWYARSLGTAVLARLSGDPGADLIATLSQSIVAVTDLHRPTCDVADPRTPQATVAIVRVHDGIVDVLVLADVFVVLRRSDGAVRVISDPREVQVREECAATLSGIPREAPEYDVELRSVTEAFRARRNRPDGYWIARDDPAAATHAVTDSVALQQWEGAVLLTNGVIRNTDHALDATWPELIHQVRTAGPAAVLQQLREREAELHGSASQLVLRDVDDATIAHCQLC